MEVLGHPLKCQTFLSSVIFELRLTPYIMLGPKTIQADGSLKDNPNTWNKEYNLLFIDQPGDTGFSKINSENDLPQNLNEVGQRFLEAFTNFLDDKDSCNHQYMLNLEKGDWFFYGREYSTKYVVKFAQLFLTRLNIKGIILADSLLNPNLVLAETSNFAFNMGLIDYQERQAYEQKVIKANLVQEQGDYKTAFQYYAEVLKEIEIVSGGMNIYNIFQDKDVYLKLVGLVDNYLNQNAEYYKFKNQSFKNYSRAVNLAQINDFLKNDGIEILESLLYKKINVLLYNSQFDLSVPSSGSMRFIYQLKYNYTNEFQKQDFKPWLQNNEIVGFGKNVANLEYKILLNSGQYAGIDQPSVVYDMIKDFISNIQ